MGNICDICAHDGAFEHGASDLLFTIGEIERLNRLMVEKLLQSHSEFESVNYDKFKDDVRRMNIALNEMSDRLDIARNFLNDLYGAIQAYFGTKY